MQLLLPLTCGLTLQQVQSAVLAPVCLLHPCSLVATMTSTAIEDASEHTICAVCAHGRCGQV